MGLKCLKLFTFDQTKDYLSHSYGGKQGPTNPVKKKAIETWRRVKSW